MEPFYRFDSQTKSPSNSNAAMMSQVLTNHHTSLCSLMVAAARPQSNAQKSVKEWRSIFDSTLQIIAQKTACPPLDEIESLAASIIIIGSEHQSLYVVAFHLLLPWQKLRGWMWVVLLELLRHHSIHKMRFLTPTNIDDIKRFKKELSVFMNMVYIPENQKASFWEDVAVVEDQSFLDECISNYARKYPVEEFSRWAVVLLQKRLDEVLGILNPNEQLSNPTLASAYLKSAGSGDIKMEKSDQERVRYRSRHRFKLKKVRKLELPPMNALNGWSDSDKENLTNTEHDTRANAVDPLQSGESSANMSGLDARGIIVEKSEDRDEEISEISADEIEVAQRELTEKPGVETASDDEMDTESDDTHVVEQDNWSLVSSLQKAVWRVFSTD